MRTQLLPPFLADDFKCKLREITCHVVRAPFRGPFCSLTCCLQTGQLTAPSHLPYLQYVTMQGAKKMEMQAINVMTIDSLMTAIMITGFCSHVTIATSI